MRAFRAIQELLACRRGVAAVEFAMAAPILLVLLIGGYELEDALTVSRKVTASARTLANLATQYTTMSEADVSLVLQASQLVLQPYSTATAGMILSEISIDSGGNATVTWSRSLNAAARVTGAAVTLPASAAMTSSSLILGEVIYSYVPPLPAAIVPTLKIYQTLYMIPRLSTSIPLSD